MTIAVVSDVHSNLHALEAVMEEIDREGVEFTLGLGDMVGYNAFPNEVVDLLQKRGVRMVLGNHDRAALTGEVYGFNPVAVDGVRYSQKVLTTAMMEILAKLPETLVVENEATTIASYHGSPREPLLEYVYPDDYPKAGPEFWDLSGADVVLLGHTHLPAHHSSGSKLIANPGSVGQPRDGDPRASYGILEARRRKFTVKRVGYDVEAAAEANVDAGLPEFLASRLLIGR